MKLLLLSGKCSRLRAQFTTYFWLGKELFSTIYSHTQKTHSDSSQMHEITLLHFTSVGSVTTPSPTKHYTKHSAHNSTSVTSTKTALHYYNRTWAFFFFFFYTRLHCTFIQHNISSRKIPQRVALCYLNTCYRTALMTNGPKQNKKTKKTIKQKLLLIRFCSNEHNSAGSISLKSPGHDFWRISCLIYRFYVISLNSTLCLRLL